MESIHVSTYTLLCMYTYTHVRLELNTCMCNLHINLNGNVLVYTCVRNSPTVISSIPPSSSPPAQASNLTSSFFPPHNSSPSPNYHPTSATIQPVDTTTLTNACFFGNNTCMHRETCFNSSQICRTSKSTNLRAGRGLNPIPTYAHARACPTNMTDSVCTTRLYTPLRRIHM